MVLFYHILCSFSTVATIIYGYQVFGANISTGDFSLCYCLRRCCPENGTKIDMAVQLLDALPETDARIILQMDSWYTCKAL